MDYTHLTAYSQQPVELFSEDPEIVKPAIGAVYSDPDNEDNKADAVDPYASQQVYDAYASELRDGDIIDENEKSEVVNALSAIKQSLQTTYASADPYFEVENKDNEDADNDEGDSSESEEDTKSGTTKPEPTTFSVKDWNAEFQQLLQAEDDYNKFVNLGKLAQEFVYTAQTYGRVIISELSVPLMHKTIKPTSIGGAAGGEKYVVNGILFKFALDFNGIYGGDENAAKAAGHDLKMSLLPISSKTLKYGSSDSGVTVHVDDDTLFKKMADTAKRLNLKGHYVGALPSAVRLIYGPGDLEGHLGSDGRYYVIDFARMFPPEAPIDNSKEKGRILYKLLRPELVASNQVPLSSDAFTGWAVLDKQHGPENNKDVLECTKRLLFEVVPAFAEDLKSRNAEYQEALYTNMPSELHRCGINIRYAGHVRRLVRDCVWGTIFLSFIIARTVSSIIRKKWRKIISSSKYITEQKCKEIAIEIINLTFVLAVEGHKEFVTGKLRKIMNRKFKFALFDDENVEDFDFVESCFKEYPVDCRLSCLKNIATQLGLELTAMGEKSISHENASLVRRDLVAIHPRVKHMNVIDIAEAQEMLYSAIYGDGAKAHFAHINEYFRSTIKNSPHLVKYQLDYVLKGSRTYRKRAKTGVLDSKTVAMNAIYMSSLLVELLDNERDHKTKYLLAIERCKIHRLGVLITENIEEMGKFVVYTGISKLDELDTDGYRALEFYLDTSTHFYRLSKRDFVKEDYLAKLFEDKEEKFKDDTRFQLLTIRYHLFRAVFFNEDYADTIIELFGGIQKPDQYLPKLLNTKKLLFLTYKQFEYEQFAKILNVARSVPAFAALLRKLIAIERKFTVQAPTEENVALLKSLTPENGFVSLKIKGGEQHMSAIDVLSHYLIKSSDLTYLEMEEIPELPASLIGCIESNKKIKHLKLLQVGPAKVLFSTIKVLAPNLESFALGETDLTPEQHSELLAALPVGLKDLRLSSSVITHDILAAPELSEMLNNVLALDLTNCTSIKTDTVAMLTKLKNVGRLILIGCTGISDQDFYASVYTVQSRSLAQIVTHHGDILEYQNGVRNVFITRMANATQFTIKGSENQVLATYFIKQTFQTFSFTDSNNQLSIAISKMANDKHLKIRGQTYAMIKSMGAITTVTIGKLLANANPGQMSLSFPGGSYFKQTNTVQFLPGACITLALPVLGALTQAL